jgi:hypothetical protein
MVRGLVSNVAGSLARTLSEVVSDVREERDKSLTTLDRISILRDGKRRVQKLQALEQDGEHRTILQLSTKEELEAVAERDTTDITTNQQQEHPSSCVTTGEPIEYSLFNVDDHIQEFRNRIQWLFAKRERAANLFDEREESVRIKARRSAAIGVGGLARMRALRKKALSFRKAEMSRGKVRRDVVMTKELTDGDGDAGSVVDGDSVGALAVDAVRIFADNDQEDKQDYDLRVPAEHIPTAIAPPEELSPNRHNKFHADKAFKTVILPTKSNRPFNRPLMPVTTKEVQRKNLHQILKKLANH